MWICFFTLSILSVFLFGILASISNMFAGKARKKISVFHMLFAGVFMATFFLFLPIHLAERAANAVFLSLFRALQVFALSADSSIIQNSMPFCPEKLRFYYQTWASVLLVADPIFTFSFILSLFKNVSAFVRYLSVYYRKIYIFSKLNEKSLSLAADIKEKDSKEAIVFNDVFSANEEAGFELAEQAKRLNAICFKNDIAAVNYGLHSKSPD